MSQHREVDKFVPTQDPTAMFQKPMGLFEISGFTATVLWHCVGEYTKVGFSALAKRLANFSLLTGLTIDDQPTEFPIQKSTSNSCQDEIDISSLLGSEESWPYLTIIDYRDAYLLGKTTPTEVARKIIDLCSSETIKSYNAVVEIRAEETMEAAELSTARYKESKTLSVVDGVPFFVKDHLKIKNYKKYEGIYDCGILNDQTAFCIQKLLDAGAVFIGTTSMNQLGSNAVGFNPSEKFPSPKNTWDNNRYAGGSSTGSGIVVALGLCPFSIGGDGLGSIRVPSACSGIVGLRSTFARISNNNCCLSPNETPFLTIGPMACCVRDAAIVYLIMAGPDKDYNYGLDQPQLQLPNFSDFMLWKVKFGYYHDYIANAEISQVEAFNKVVEKLKSVGCKVEDINVPEINETAIAAMLGMINLSYKAVKNREKNGQTSEFNDINLKFMTYLGSTISESDLIQARKQRTRSMKIWENIFKEFDVFLLLTTSRFPEHQHPSHSYRGYINTWTFSHQTLFSSISSLTGIPSLAITIGKDPETNLPISLQLMSKWWSEDLLLSVAYQIERLFPLTSTPPDFQQIFQPNK